MNHLPSSAKCCTRTFWNQIWIFLWSLNSDHVIKFLVWTGKPVNLHLETHKEGEGRQLLCCSATSPEVKRRFVPLYLRHIKLQRKKIITLNIQVFKISGVCEYILHRLLCLSPLYICLRWVPVTSLPQNVMHNSSLSTFTQLPSL